MKIQEFVFQPDPVLYWRRQGRNGAREYLAVSLSSGEEITAGGLFLLIYLILAVTFGFRPDADGDCF